MATSFIKDSSADNTIFKLQSLKKHNWNFVLSLF